MPFLAIDLSNNNQEPVDLDMANRAGHIKLLVHKATEGTTFTDSWYGVRMTRARHAGMHRMSYHFAHPENDPILSARFAAAIAMPAYGPYSTGALDLEEEAADLPQWQGDASPWALLWLREFLQVSGRKPWVYASTSFIQAHLSDPALGDYALWLANWPGGDPDQAWLLAHVPPAPGPWSGGAVTMWQYTDAGAVPGIPSAVDKSIFLGTEEAFRRLH